MPVLRDLKIQMQQIKEAATKCETLFQSNEKALQVRQPNLSQSNLQGYINAFTQQGAAIATAVTECIKEDAWLHVKVSFVTFVHT